MARSAVSPAKNTLDLQHRFTQAANATIAPLHDRMPVIMAPNHFDWWMKDDDPLSESHKMAMGHPLEGPMKIYPVSNLVNSPKLDDPRCIEPVRVDRDMFERQWWGDA
jgi:putative SOS response-associated peptidase YedK